MQLHAEYDRKCNDYIAHRVVQAFDTAQFVETTRGDASLQILAGDLNTEPGDLAYRALLASSGLHEACNQLMHDAGTNECQYNTYTTANAKKTLPNGKRIDYILYRGANKFETKVLEYKLPLPEYIPNHQLSYSDHEAVMIKIRVIDPDEPGTMEETCRYEAKIDAMECKKTLQESIDVCDDSLNRLHSHRRCYLLMAVITFALLIYVLDTYPPFGWKAMYWILKIVLSAVALYFVFMGTLWNLIEYNGIYSGKLAMEMALQSITLDDNELTRNIKKECL